MSNQKQSNLFKSCLKFFISLLVIGLALAIFFNRQLILDQVSVWQYQPTSVISAIAKRANMSSKGKYYFYIGRPVLAGADDFNTHCARQEDNNAILGCYQLNQIYLYDINNEQLDGIEEVTAAHEMLHVAWERLDDKEKAHLSKLIEAAYSKLETAELKERMNYYDRTQPGERANELHSILGTEYSDIGKDLETYYAKYFNDRSVIITLYNNYKQVFDDIKTQSATLSVELDNLADEINLQITLYNKDVAVLGQDIASLNARANMVDQTNEVAVYSFNQDRDVLLYRIAQLEATRTMINSKVDFYNNKLGEYNRLIIQSNELNKSIDSTLAPSPSL